MIRHILMVSAMLAGTLVAQNFQRQARMVGGGDRDHGKCTIEVVVDDAAEVEIRGTSANLRTLAGQAAEWRRFECNAPFPPNPSDFRFAGVDGRGRQTLVRDPRNGGAAVVRIEDPASGREGYTFDIFWSLRGGGSYAPPPPERREDDRERRGEYRNGDYYKRLTIGWDRTKPSESARMPW